MSFRPYTITGTTLTYQIHCYENFADASSGLNKQITKLGDMLNLTSLEDCITECAIYNSAVERAHPDPSLDLLCSGVVYVASDTPTKCDLNTGVGSDAVSVSFGKDQQVDSAVLDWDSS